MKHFLKPLGHCLTTAVMTSAMLRVYALPAVEAATPDAVPPPSTAEEATSPSGDTTVLTDSEGAPSTQPVAPPEVLAPVETRPVHAGAASTPIAPEAAAPKPTLEAGSPPPPPLETPRNKPTASVESAGASAGKPAAPEVGSSLNSTGAPSPEGVAPETGKVAPAMAPPQGNVETQARNIAGMRQVLEKRLAEVVEQGKAARDAQWLQNVTLAALQYAWQGQFEQARQIAANPALPSEVQAELLGKIIAIETQQSSPIAQQPHSPASPSSPTPPNSVQPGGRQVPSNYPTVGAQVSDYAEFSLRNQCPAIPVTHATHSANRPAAAAPTAKLAKVTSRTPSAQSNFPAFLPALGANLATRLAELNRTQAAATPVAKTAPTTPSKQPIVSPQLFAGVATSSLQNSLKTAQPSVAGEAPAVNSPVVNSPVVNSPAVNSPAVSSPAVSSPTVNPTAVNSPTVATALSSAPGATHQPALNPTTDSAAPDQAAEHKPSKQALGATDEAVSGNQTLDQTLDQMVESTLSYSFEQLGLPLAQLIPDPLNLAWNWWMAPNLDQVTETTFGQSALGSSTFSAASPLSGTGLAQLGLGNTPLLKTLKQELTATSSPLRDGRKLSIPSLPKATSQAAAKAPVQDAATLLAVSCANAQLAHYDSSYRIDPTTSKRLGWVNLMYPLPIPAVITSVFGWRVHPISGNLSFHTGLDIGAPMGTPVLSALPGRVVAADYMGGYGLAVVVENEATKQRNLYGHLSGIAVQPGAQVAQGMILGWVGSTGNSTGPHLHFEALVHTKDGWTAVDPLASATVAIAQGKSQ